MRGIVNKKRCIVNAMQRFVEHPISGESGIRTHGDISATLDFESSALDQLSHLSRRVEEGRGSAFFL